MKTKLYILASLLFFLLSCTEEGPFTMEKLECEIKTSMVTPTAAIVTVTLPPNSDLSKRVDYVYLSDYPIDNLKDFQREKLIRGSNWNRDEGEYYFRDLKPNTKYYVIVGLSINYNDNTNNDSWDYESEPYCPGFSFTTAMEGDYSNLGDVTCEFYGYSSDGDVLIKFNFPASIIPTSYYYGDMKRLRAYASTSPDMTNPIESAIPSLSLAQNNIFGFRGLEDKKYYFQLYGDFFLFDDHDDVLKDIRLNVKNPIDLSINADNKKYCETELDFVGVNFSLFRMKLPEGYSNYTFNNAEMFYNDNTNKKALKVICQEEYCFLYIEEVLKNEEKLSFSLSGMANNTSDGFLYPIELSSDIIIDQNEYIDKLPSNKIIFEGIDYTIAEIVNLEKIPQLISLYPDCLLSNDPLSFSNSKRINLFNQCLILNSVYNHKNNYVRLLGGIYINGFDDGYCAIDVEGMIPSSTSEKRLFDVKVDKNENGLSIKLICPNEFSYQGSSDVSLKIWDQNNWLKPLFTIDSTVSLSAGELLFVLTNSQIEEINWDSQLGYCLEFRNINVLFTDKMLPFDDGVYCNGRFSSDWQWIFSN